MNTHHLAAGLGLAILALSVTGCSTAGPPAADSGATDPPAAPSEPSPSPSLSPAETLTSAFAFDAATPPAPGQWLIAWDDHFAVTEGFSVLSADDGEGSWAYRDDRTQCTVAFYQGSAAAAGLDASAGDREQSDEFIGIVMQAPPEMVEQYVEDYDVPVWGEDDSVAFRTLGGAAEDGSTRVDTARVVPSLDVVLHVTIGCPPGQDAFTVRDRLAEEVLAVGALEGEG